MRAQTGPVPELIGSVLRCLLGLRTGCRALGSVAVTHGAAQGTVKVGMEDGVRTRPGGSAGG